MGPRLFDYVPDAEGFIYESHQLPGDCIVLFQNETTRVFEPIGPAEPLRLDPVRSLLQREAARVGASVDFEEMPSIPDSPKRLTLTQIRSDNRLKGGEPDVGSL